ncbi:hypothetical protein SSBR45G_23950 [Bradyrhizobium sp. SSBR45G]|uniref:hypothetical protein n=1 Tax=unclassified Bradyrhizobium TaxID=2631580 RepID=UPI0023429E39|nr:MULTISPECIES: hypothetical protein [unclassified Bradyrhizobium]GLH77487.1 hypothetical protein SSBR45G_23950 [Bradyrhizobium sp. SSBR45G]GLH84407.1 hypothetical protein SSBR45R_18670 [Bradyrhizobium sp. SSBR45R]
MRCSAELACVDPGQVGLIWPQVAARVRRAVLRTGLSAFADIERDVLAGRALLWLALSRDGDTVAILSVATTRIEVTETGKICVIVACQGRDRRRWLPLIGGIETYARAEGCRSVRIFGRKGWQRVLDGYAQTHVIMEKEMR